MRKLLGYLAAIAAILIAWELLALFLKSPALPTPFATLPALIKYTPRMLPDFGISFYRVISAMLLGTVVAMPLGLVIGRSKRLDTFFAPLLYLLYPIPKIVFLPILLIFLGLGNAPKIVLIAITIFFQVLVTVRDSARNVPEAAVTSIRSLGANSFDVYRHVVVPACLPELFTALRISSGTAIAILFFAESFAGKSGLGYFITESWSRFNFPGLFSGIIAMAILGVILYEAFDLIEKRLLRWRRQQKK